MAPLTPGQLRTRRRVESVIHVIAPALDLVLAAGDLHQAQQITAEVAKAALPEFYFHQRGG